MNKKSHVTKSIFRCIQAQLLLFEISLVEMKIYQILCKASIDFDFFENVHGTEYCLLYGIINNGGLGEGVSNKLHI